MPLSSLTFFGHAFFSITTSGGKKVLLDPWVEGNPACPITLADITAADLVLVTHDHADHVGQAGDIVKKTGAMLVANVETASRLARDHDIPQDQVLFGGYGMNIGGTTEVAGVRITQTQAFHSSASGVATGYILQLEDGPCLYHAGDTGVFGSMGTLAATHGINVALLPIGSVFTMDPVQALAAVGLIKPKLVVPMHYGTFPILVQSADDFAQSVRKTYPEVRVSPLKPGETIELNV
ncbi:MAG: metal-dependent hydrolase [Deltaproteobacteria bacterium]|nr:metal-dependent hydrolase [Deltaproteobacteria bacterium]